MSLKELLPARISTMSHSLNLCLFEGVHSNTSHKRDVYSKTSVYTGASKANEDTEFWGRPLWGRGTTVTTPIVRIRFLDLQQLRNNCQCALSRWIWGGDAGVDTLDLVSGSTSHIAPGNVVDDVNIGEGG